MKARQKFLMAAVGLAVIGLAIIYVPRRTETPTAQAEEAAGQRSPDAGHVVEPSAPMAQATDRAVPPAAVGSSSASKADAGRNGAAAGAAAPSMEAPWRRFIDAEIVESRTSQPDARGLVERIRVVRTAMKYPHIRIVEQVPAGNPAGEPVSFAASVADHMVVRVRDGLSEEKVATIARQHGFSVRKKMLAPDTYLIAFDDASIDALPAAILLFSREANAVQYAEADALIFASATAPNDPAFGQLWGMHQSNDKDIDAPEAWDLSQGSSNVVVAVIDTGIDYTHEDLAANLWRNPGEIPNNGTDDDGNGFVDDIYGWDFANDDSDPYDDNSHGTHSAGTIGGMGNNGIGVAGVNWNVRLMAVKFMTAGGSGFASDAVDSVYYTTARGVRLTSNSWGSYAGMQSLRDAIDNAGASNILFVAAAGNDANNNETTPAYPASFASANIISVAATDAGDDLAWFSNYGHTSVDLGAPGVEIYSTVPTAQGRYASFSGTSMATPHVAGACALLAAYSPTLTAAQIKQRILDNTDRSPTLSGKTVSGGRLNVAKALSGSVPLEPPAAPSALSATPFADLIELTWTDNATNETLFVLERRSGSSGFTVLATLTSNTTSRTDTNVMGGVTYTYRIKARNAAGDSAYCSEASATVPGAADAWDPGDDTSAGGTALIAITTNEATHGPHTLSGTDLADWYQVALQAGGAYDFNAIGGSGDTYAELFRDAAATQLVASDDDGGGGLMFRLEHVADATATYYLRVRTYGTGVSAAYNLKYRMTDTANQTPSVSLTSPDSNVVYQAPGSIAIVASASDPDGSIVQVQFYSGTNVLAIDTTAPYAFTWGAVAAGSYALTAVAMDNEGIAATSTTVNVMVNAQPSVTLTEPANGAVLIAPTNVAISAAATDPDGVVQSVSFYDGDNLLGTDTTSPFGIVWGSPSVGAHTLVAQVVDDLSGQSVSAPVHVTIDSGTPILSVSPLTVGAECLEGANASSNAFSVVNVGNGTLTYTIVDNAGWLSISPTNGSSVGTPNVHRLMYSSAGLAAGVYSAVVTVEAADADDSPQMVAVTLTVRSADPTIALDTTSLSRTFQIGQPALDDTVAVWNSGAGTLNYTNATDVPWLAVNPAVGTSTGEHDTITLSYDTTSLAEGSYTGAVVVSAAGATNSPQTITVRMSIQPTVGLMGRFVSPSGQHVSPFTNWWGAATNIQAAVDAASDGDTIWVTNGIYVLPAQITISKGIIVKGVGGASNVVIDGGYPSRTNRCFNLNHAAIELDGLTISNGCVRGAGGGVYMAKPALVRNSMITGNYTSTTNNTGSGAGVYMVNGGTLDTCSIVRNTILNTNDGGYGGGIWMSNSGVVVRCVVADNDGGPGVGGILARIASLIDSCVITNNRGGPWSSGGVRILGATIRNSLLVANRSSGPSGGIDDSNSSYGAAIVENCTIVSNFTSRASGPLVAGGIVAFATNAPMIVRNTIMLSNGASNSWEHNFSGRQTNVFHSCTADWLPPEMGNVHVEQSSSADVFESGYRLTPGSPCIDSGTNMAWMAESYDLEGVPRIVNGVVDMGACEFSTSYACISGAVYYMGSQTGQIVVVAGTYTNTVASSGAYSIAGLPVPSSYSLSAFMDVNQNSRRDPAEPFGQYSGNPLIVSNDMSDIDIALIDAASETFSISGNINYDGGYGGRVIVSLLDDSPFNEYLEVALSQGSQATSYPVSGLVGPPPGGWTDEYKTTKMVFRRIQAGTFIMGSPTNEIGRISNETQHQVTLTDDFYVGVFEVTQRQWERVMGTWPSYFTNEMFRDTRPVECMTYDAIRGSIAGASWPTSYDVDADSFMGRLRARTGRAFDLPTEAQWEYAGRACSTTALNSGRNLTVTGSECSNLSAVARNLHNGGQPGWGHREATISAGTAAVGSYQANAWGLHDIHGNVWEWCLDWYGAYSGTVTDPKGLISGSSRVFRGGGWYHENLYHRSAYRNYKSPSQGSNGLGFRVVSASGQDGFTRSIVGLESPGMYVFSNLFGQLNYQVMAYRDINGNGIRDSFEPQGSYANNPIYLTNSVTDGHITLFDPDTDGDGLSDAYELGYGRYQVVTGSYTWAEAKVDAETRGAHLATITSASEWNAIRSVASDIPCGLWLGGSDEEQEGVWRWVTGEPWGYTRWQPLEPDGNTSENWLEIWADPSNGDRLWNDIGSTNVGQGYLLERGWFTSPTNADTDGDGLSDGQEVNVYHTDPTNPDTDGDGLNDAAEVAAGTNPLDPDSDDDGLNDYYEVITRPGLNALDPDTDRDGIPDGVEVEHGSDPCDAESRLHSIGGTIEYDGELVGPVVMDLDMDQEYMVVDLSEGQSASNYPATYLPSVPVGGWSDEHKTTKMVLRRIPAGTFMMGSPTNELGRNSNEPQHEVTLTKGFYVGVFEVTQKQWERVMGAWPSYYSNVICRDSRPVEQVSYNMIRGSTAGAGWPANNSVDADSFMGRLRARIGKAFDLPTESQREYACRAGTTTALNSGKNLTSTESCPNMSELGRYWYNGGSGYSRTGDTSVATAQVGSYIPNAWGLYDMHGNVWEWCLDWYETYPGTGVDPMGPSSGTKRLYRGGSWFRGASYGRAAFRNFSEPPANISYGVGFRVALPADNRRHLQVILDRPGPYAVSNLLSHVNHTITAFMDCDGNGIMDDGEPRGAYALNPLYLTNNVTGIDIQLSVPTTGWTMRATHKLAEYASPGTNTVECEVYFPTNQSLIALGWTVSLPDGWALVSASGDGQPAANPTTGEILFSGLHLTNNPVRFTYAVSAPAGESGQKTIQGTVDYFLTGVGGWEVRMADPDPLIVNPASPYHSSDFRDPKWVIDMQECNRTLSYWRSGGYGVRPGTVDGYAPNESSQDGQRHKADYQSPFWQLDGEEALRVMGYWMAGGYHREASGDDGYAPGMATNGSMGIMDIGDISAMTVAPSTYVPGHHVTLRGTLSYSNDILGLLWKPQLPVGWTILSASANGGTPEVVNNEILFTSKLPPSPLEVTYVCEVPGEMTGDALVRTDVQLMRQGSVNPQSLFGMLAPNMLQLDTDGDGLPDWVETGTGVYRSPTDTGSDPNKPDTDGDGAPDRNEVLSGTNPNQGGDAFRIMGIDALPGDQIMAIGQPLVVRWSSVAGKTYSVSRSTNLVEGFSTIRSNVLATPPANSFIDSSSPEKEVFYLIGVE